MNTRIITAFVVMAMVLMPCILSQDADASGSWWGKATDIYIEAGSGFSYDSISSPDGKEIRTITVEGAFSDSFEVKQNGISGYIPRDTPSGDYQTVLKVTTSSGTSQMMFRFHVTAVSDVNPGYAANQPIINNVTISPVGNFAKTVLITVDTANASSVKFDYGDDIETPSVALSSDSTSFTHKYTKDGMYQLNVTVSNAYGSAQKVVIYDAENGEVTEADVQEASSDDSKEISPIVWVGVAVAALGVIGLAVMHRVEFALGIAAGAIIGLAGYFLL